METPPLYPFDYIDSRVDSVLAALMETINKYGKWIPQPNQTIAATTAEWEVITDNKPKPTIQLRRL